MFKFQGKIKVINETQVISEKFKKREFVVTDTSSMYPQDVMFQSVQDKCDMLNGYSVEDQVEVSFNLRGREWTSPDGVVKYFNTLDAWRIEKMGQGGGIPAAGPSDIIWENRELSESTRFFRGVIAFLIIAIMLMISAVIIYILNQQSSNFMLKYPKITCLGENGFFATMYQSNLDDIQEAAEKEFTTNYQKTIREEDTSYIGPL